MDFRLTFEGPLYGTGNPAHKHSIRKVFHKQLKRLWDIDPVLRNLKASSFDWQGKEDRDFIDYYPDKYTLCGFRFAPLATEARQAQVTLRILFLRSGVPGNVLRSADLDARLKTLLTHCACLINALKWGSVRNQKRTKTHSSA